MPDNSANNKRIAKNTFVLYLRMLVLMAVSLYTSRIVLSALGIVDFGIYNVVGGVVSLIGFLNGTLSTASSRYITVALGHHDLQKMRQVFASVLQANACLSLLVLVLSESIGLWFLLRIMNIPQERTMAAMWVYQLSVLTVITNIISVPYNATIIAHERIKAFAYLSLFEAFAKLCIAYSLSVAKDMDRLIMYSGLLFMVQIINRLIYGRYCIKRFPETHYKFYFEKGLMREMIGFISWSAYGSFVSVGFNHGLNILLNMFFGPAVNAARGVAVQVQNAVVAFSTNFQTAINPQLTKSVAIRNYSDSCRLLSFCSRLSFILLCILGLPVILETHFVLHLWLVEIPDNAVVFVQLMLIISIWSSLAYPLRIVNQAEGDIKRFQLYECSWLLLVVPISYCVLKVWQVPALVFVIHLLIELSAQILRLHIVLPKIGMPFKEYMATIYIKLLIIFVLPLLFSSIVKLLLAESLFRFLIVGTITELTLIVLTTLFVLDDEEKKDLKGLLKYGRK